MIVQDDDLKPRQITVPLLLLSKVFFCFDCVVFLVIIANEGILHDWIGLNIQ